MLVADFDYELPKELIAQEPCPLRDRSRLMVVKRKQAALEHRLFYNLLDYLNPGDVLVLNETRVISARLWGRRADTGAKLEVFLLQAQESPLLWEVLVKPGRKAQPGMRLCFASPLDLGAEAKPDGEQQLLSQKPVPVDPGAGSKPSGDRHSLLMEGLVREVTDSGSRIIEFSMPGMAPETLASRFAEILEMLGETPLPPYINRSPGASDRQRYQTVYAKTHGSVAAPTAGLHFTPQLLAEIQQKGVLIVSLVLHVGLGTFRPVKAEKVEQHQMHSEYYSISGQTAEVINQARRQGGRVLAVGTTSARVLETVADASGQVCPQSGWTDIFIYPGYRFKVVDGLITNFHLPRSTLLMLVSALAGKELVFKAYQEAVQHRYRFFSYGDAMLII